MNSLFIHASHHGSITVVSNRELVAHAQLDRFNRFKNSGLPSYDVIKNILKRNIKFDKIVFTFLKNQNHFKEWYSFLVQFNILNKNTVFYYDFRRHHNRVYFNHFNGSPKYQLTNEYLVPCLTLSTLCHKKEGKTTIVPISKLFNLILRISLYSV